MHHVRRVVNFVRGMFRGDQGHQNQQAQLPAQPPVQPAAQPAVQPPRRRRMTADRQIVAQVQLVLPAYPVQQLPAGVVRRSTRDRRPVERYQAVW